MYYPAKVKKLSDNQVNRLIAGHGVRVSKGQGDTIYLSEPQLKKLNKAHLKGKGLTVNFDPYQATQHRTLKQGGALGKAFKNLGKAVRKDAGQFGREVGQISKSTGKQLGKTFNKELGQELLNGLEIAGLHAIEQGLPIATTLGSMALGDPTGLSGAAFGNIGAQYASDAYKRDVMGKGFFKTLHKVGIKKKDFMGGLKKTASMAAKLGSQAAGEAITSYTGNPMLGQQFSQMSDKVAENAIKGNLKKGLKQAGNMSLEMAERFGVEAIDDTIDNYLSGNEKKLAQNLLARKYPNSSDLIYDMSDMYTGTKGGMGMKKRGRPKKRTGGALYPA